MSKKRFADLRAEFLIFLWYASAVFRPGATLPPHPDVPPSMESANLRGWQKDDLDVYIEESRRLVDQQQADKRDTRGRAQVLLTTSLVLIGAILADFSSRSGPRWWIVTAYAVAFVLVLTAALAAAGIITAQSPIGSPNMIYVEKKNPGEARQAVADGYRSIRDIGATTVALMVTALRSSTLVLVLGFVAGALAHLLPGPR